jgi:pyruvate/2-oxoglutarate dehydrogenase complex dihydrolipoamide dehydrogenase (E3) component
VNVGCTPTKAMVASAYAAHLAARSRDYGVILPAGPRGRYGAWSATAPTPSSAPAAMDSSAGFPGCPAAPSSADTPASKANARSRWRSGLLKAERIFINVGGRPSASNISGLDQVDWLSSSDMVKLRELPRQLVVIGGSYVGLEFAQMFRRFGAPVTVVERGPRLIPREDEEVSAQVQAILENEGIVFRLGVECIQLRPHADGTAVVTDAGADQLVGSHVLVAAGRVPNTDDLDLARAGVEIGPGGTIKVDGQLATSAPGIWALGDCNGRGAFTHTAYNDFEIVAANLLDGAKRSVDDRIPVYALYIDPPLGRVGLTLQQALAQGHRVRVGQRPMTRVGRAVEKGESQGSMRVIVDAQTDAILGAAILGPGGDEAVHMVLAAMAAGMTNTRLAQIMAIHPTVSELIPTIAGELGPEQAPS